MELCTADSSRCRRWNACSIGPGGTTRPTGSSPPSWRARVAGRRPTESELEDDLLAVIRRHGLPEPEPQYPYRGRRIDFAYPELLIGIEANSVQAHAAKEDIQRNAEKANDLIDWWVLYFTHHDVHSTPARVGSLIEETIARRKLMLVA